MNKKKKTQTPNWKTYPSLIYHGCCGCCYYHHCGAAAAAAAAEATRSFLHTLLSIQIFISLALFVPCETWNGGGVLYSIMWYSGGVFIFLANVLKIGYHNSCI